MSRTDSVSGLIAAAPARVFAAFIDPDELVQWLPPEGMTGRFLDFDPTLGGSYRMALVYDDATGGHGKTSVSEDVSAGRFVEISPGERVVHDVEFDSEDPSFAGTMRLTWQVHPAPDGRGSVVELRADDVPEGISQDDHLTGMSSSLTNLASHLARSI